MAVGDHFQINLLQRWQDISGQLLENVFCYEQTNGIGNAAELAANFILQVMDNINSVQHVDVQNQALSVINLDNLADYYTTVLPGVGAIGEGESLPPYASWTFRYIRATRAVRDGRKAFAGVPELWQTGGVTTGGATLTTLNNLAASLQASVADILSSSSWDPRIWRRPGVYGSGTVAPPGAFYPIAGVAYAAISTQNTRKYGRGV